jgi:hypothetical protein
MAVNKLISRAYYSTFSRYAVIYNGGKAALYLYKRWNIKKLQSASENDWARIIIGEKITAVIIWFIYSFIQISGRWNTLFSIIQPVNYSVLMGDFNIYYPLWDIHGRSLRGNNELAAYMLRWNMILHIPFKKLTRYKYGQRNSIINLA